MDCAALRASATADQEVSVNAMRLTGLMWWIDRWRKSTAYMDLTLEEQGAYRNLIDEATLRGGPIPDDERILAKACGDALAWKRLRPAIIKRFVLKPDGWHNETLDEVIKSSTRRVEKQRRYRNRTSNTNGNGGGNGEGNGGGNALGIPPGNDAGNATGYPDLGSGILDLGSKNARSRAKIFSGVRLKVSQAQHQLVVDELGSLAERVDLLTKYAEWDRQLVANREVFDALEYIKRRAMECVQAVRADGPVYSDDFANWCQHEPPCNSRVWHQALLQRESEAVVAGEAGQRRRG
jgi:uncharacterized protein YdaU (DUF1376 family)